MAPLRRYLRITKHSALEVRIYLDNPAHAETWLLRRNDPALPRIIEAVRPLVLPKLWEEKERSERRGKGKKGVKDVVAGGTKLHVTSIKCCEGSDRAAYCPQMHLFGTGTATGADTRAAQMTLKFPSF